MPLFESSILTKLTAKSGENDVSRVPYIVEFYADVNRAEERAYLDRVFQSYPDGRKKQNLKRFFLSVDDGQHHGAWGELVLYDWLKRMDMDPVPEPDIQGVTPDFLISSQETEICVEVFVIRHSPQDENIARRSGSVWWPEATATYKAAGSIIASKLTKYRECERPYVICGVVRNWVIGLPEMVKQYFPRLFEDHGPYGVVKAYQHVSALLVMRAQWPQNADRYLIDSSLIENTHATYPLPDTVFG